MKMITQISVVAAVVLSLTAVSVSEATPMLRITDGINTVTVSDNAVGLDSAAALGQVLYANSSFFGWNILVSSGVTKPIVGSSTSPALDLNWFVTRGAGSLGTLTIFFSENGFNVTPAGNFVTSAGGTLGNSGSPSANVRTYYDLGNTELATTTLLTSHLFTGQGGYSGNDAGGPVGPDNSIAFTIRLDVSLPIGGVASGDIDLGIVGVPESGSMVTLLGTGLLALGILAVRCKSVRAVRPAQI